MTGTGSGDSSGEAVPPVISEMTSPCKIGSNRITADPTMTAAVRASDTPSRSRSSMKSTEMIGFPTTMPAPAMNRWWTVQGADGEVRGREALLGQQRPEDEHRVVSAQPRSDPARGRGWARQSPRE